MHASSTLGRCKPKAEGPRPRGLGLISLTSTHCCLMSSPFILTGTLDDIVFEGRNQAYGAFQLRRSYRRHLGTALLITVLACSVLLVLPAVVRYFLPEVVVAPPVIPDLTQPQPQVYDLPKIKPVL